MQEGAHQSDAAPMNLESFLHYWREGEVDQVRGWRRQTAHIGGQGGHKMKIEALEPNSTKFCIYNQWAPRSLKMQKLEKNENLVPCTKLNQILYI